MKEFLLREWPVLKQSFLIGVSPFLALLYSLFVVEFCLNKKEEPEYELPFRF